MIIADVTKRYFNRCIIPPIYFWRDSSGNEVDCLIDTGEKMQCIEIKSATTVSSDFFKGLDFYRGLNAEAEPILIYGGDTNGVRKNGKILAWNAPTDC